MISIFGYLVLAPIWMIPAVAATFLHPDLAAEFRMLNNPNEGAYVAMAQTLLPTCLLADGIISYEDEDELLTETNDMTYINPGSEGKWPVRIRIPSYSRLTRQAFSLRRFQKTGVW